MNIRLDTNRQVEASRNQAPTRAPKGLIGISNRVQDSVQNLFHGSLPKYFK